MKKYIYLAGAMEQISNEEASEWRKLCKENFKAHDSNFECIDPTDYYAYGSNYHTNDFEVFRFDIHKVKTSDLVLVNLSNLRKSVGTCDEILYAYMNGIPVIGFLETENNISTDDLISIVHPWKYVQINRIETGTNAMMKAIDYIRNYY